MTLEKKGTLFWEDRFSGAATKKTRGKREPLNNDGKRPTKRRPLANLVPGRARFEDPR